VSLSGRTLRALAERHGPAFFLYHPDRVRRAYSRFLGAFRRIYPDTLVAYSVKTNYLPRLCADLHRLGARAEVVSPLEYELARRLGFRPRDIVVNGPYKPAPFLERALAEGALVNLDSLAELELALDLQRRHGRRRFRAGLRVDVSAAGDGEGASRFGLSVEAGEWDRALALLGRRSLLDVRGLHAHYCFKGKAAGSYARLAGALLDLHRAWTAGGRPALAELNVGGGFYSEMPPELAGQFPAPVAAFVDYAQALAGAFAAAWPSRPRPLLVLEPGIALAAPALSFVTTVDHVKERGDRRLAVVAGSVYDVRPTKARVNLPVRIHRRGRPARGSAAASFDVVGQTCMEDDVLHRGLPGPLAPGDLLEFGNAGAYSIVLKPPFIYGELPVLGTTPSGSVRLLRREGSFEDVFGPYRFRSSAGRG
jgi:diaminopimelate decarboxylase